jgi:hypothetical protein
MTKSWLGTLLLGTLAALAQAQEPAPTRKPGSVEVGKDGTVTVSGKATYADSKQDVPREGARQRQRDAVVHERGRAGRAGHDGRDRRWDVDRDLLPPGARWRTTGSHLAHRCEDRGQPGDLETDDLSLAEGADLTLRLRAIRSCACE